MVRTAAAWRRRHSSQNGGRAKQQSVQLYRPEGIGRSKDGQSSADRDLEEWTRGEDIRKRADNERTEPDPQEKMMAAFEKRRKEIREMAAKLSDGGAEFDQDGRLVQTAPDDDDDAAAAQGGGLQPQQPAAGQPQALMPLIIAHLEDMEGNVPRNNRNEERRIAEQREAAEAIARAVARYRADGVRDDDLELIPLELERDVPANLTFRRICITVLAVATAFVCVLFQFLEPIEEFEISDPFNDPLMYDLLEVRSYWTHYKNCPGLHRQPNTSWRMYFSKALGLNREMHCDDGVLWLPSTSTIDEKIQQISTGNHKLLEGLRKIEVAWDIPCVNRSQSSWPKNSSCHNMSPESQSKTCSAQLFENRRCFRGVHDESHSIKNADVNSLLSVGTQMINSGGDHYDIHYDIAHLEYTSSGIIKKLRKLLRESYGVDSISPVAFRILTSASMEGRSINWHYPAPRTINQTNFNSWVRSSRRHNDKIKHKTPLTRFRLSPKRDTCNLMADMDVDTRFHILTAVHLTNAGTAEQIGGVSLFVDHDDPSNKRSGPNKRKRIQRGVIIDTSAKRVVVSTGGRENRRCQMPLRAGARSMLQVWWSYDDF